MEPTTLFWALQALVGAFCTVLWASFLDVKRKAEQASIDLATYKITVAEKYASAAELRESLQAINRFLEGLGNKLDARLERIEDKLDQKVDK